jgi:hypothetical protein
LDVNDFEFNSFDKAIFLILSIQTFIFKRYHFAVYDFGQVFAAHPLIIVRKTGVFEMVPPIAPEISFPDSVAPGVFDPQEPPTSAIVAATDNLYLSFYIFNHLPGLLCRGIPQRICF